MRMRLILLCSVFSSRYQLVWSLMEAPAVGSGAPQTVFIAVGWALSSSSSSRCAVGNICCGSSLIRYCANFCNWSRCRRVRDSETGARRQTSWGYREYRTYWLVILYYSVISYGTYAMYTMQADCNHMGTPVSGGGAGAVAGRDPTTVECDGYIKISSGCLAHTRRQVKTYWERIDMRELTNLRDSTW